MTNEAEVYFALFGVGLEPDEVTQSLGLEPTTIKSRVPPKSSAWEISSGKIEADFIDVNAISSELVAKLSPKVEVIKAVKERLGLQGVLEVVLWISTDDSVSTPAIGFDKDVIDFLAAVGATIDVDTYLRAP